MIINGIELKPGMVLEGTKGVSSIVKIIVIPTQNKIGFVNLNTGQWSEAISSFITDLQRIRGLAKNAFFIDSGDILWEKEVIISLKEIAEKFNIAKGTKIRIEGITYEN